MVLCSGHHFQKQCSGSEKVRGEGHNLFCHMERAQAFLVQTDCCRVIQHQNFQSDDPNVME